MKAAEFRATRYRSKVNRYVGLCHTLLIPLVGEVGSAESWLMLHIDDRKVDRREEQSRQRKSSGDGGLAGWRAGRRAGRDLSLLGGRPGARAGLMWAGPGEVTGCTGQGTGGRRNKRGVYIYICRYSKVQAEADVFVQVVIVARPYIRTCFIV